MLGARAGRVTYDAPARALTSDLLAEMRRHKGELLDLLAQDDPARAPEPPAVEVPRSWIDGFERLARMSCPSTYPPTAWERAISDTEQFMDRWAHQAAMLGWPDWEIWGAHRRAPWHRLDGRGLVLALQGDKVGVLTATEAVVVKASGARLTFRRRVRDPLHPSERALVWELE